MANEGMTMGGKTVWHEVRSARMLFDKDEWSNYLDRTRNGENRLTTQIGKYLWNDFDICLNPEVMSLVVDGKYNGYYVTIKWADCGNGIWSSALDYGTGDGGGGYGVSFADRLVGDKYDWRAGYPSEVDAKVAACDKALVRLHNSRKQNDKLQRLIRMVEDYRKSIKPKVVQLDLFGELFGS